MTRMAQLNQVDHYGFPIGMSIEFRRAMHRFERHDRQRAGAFRGRVNVVVPFPVDSGGMRVQVDNARMLAAAGFDVHVFQLRNSEDADQIDAAPFARVCQIGDQDQLYRELSAARALVTIVGCWIDYPPAVEAATAPVIGYSGGEPTLNDDSKIDDRMAAFRAAAHDLPVHLVTCSRFIQRVWQDTFDRRSAYVPVALDGRAFQDQERPPLANRPLRVLLVAWDGLEDKGLAYAIPAVAGLRPSLDIQLVWITPRKPVIFTDLECELHVNPPKDELYRVLGGCDVLVYPPIIDGLGLPPLEAMAAGVPVVVACGTGADEFAEDAVNAVTVPPKDVEAIQEAVRRVVDDPEFAASLCVNGRKTAARYHPDASSAAWVATVENVIRGSRDG